ncbi:GNAT family N-acetyltransferase [Formosa algae]|uniref:GNAT superfamily N-acetyltransferase n=1 Tax=Formosa algae TaxID=225843 RepID=A0A9X1CCM9_9FLAO|nr:GNAT family N-acetyltransferase [Formosa algae]MBP1840425.1 GNAT superfamily N-acetyltransferase [Formosa algae]MDQ0336917.1 GNAT superfamily N-acetyltransferase [Formosa algae]OEI80810.1 GNAT family N-acetyltransferase [Formosa algae]
MNIKIRPAKIEDMAGVLELIYELAIYEKEPEAVEVTVSDLERDGFGAHPLFTCFVAEIEGEIKGIALVYNRYSTWKGPIIHLEDLIVNEAYRGTGVGTALLNEVVKYGHSKGAKRINWEVIDWNEPAIAFYESKGATVLRDWDVVQLNEAAIKNYIDKL